MELWDAYYQDGTPAGQDLIRGEPIPKGLYHLVSEVIVVHTDGSYLLMQRDRQKPNFLGLYEATADGSALKGESAYEAAIRELWEETGIAADHLQPLCQAVSHDTIYQEFLCVTTCPKDAVALQEGETISYCWLSKEAFLRFVESDRYVPTHRDRIQTYLNDLR